MNLMRKLRKRTRKRKNLRKSTQLNPLWKFAQNSLIFPSSPHSLSLLPRTLSFLHAPSIRIPILCHFLSRLLLHFFLQSSLRQLLPLATAHLRFFSLPIQQFPRSTRLLLLSSAQHTPIFPPLVNQSLWNPHHLHLNLFRLCSPRILHPPLAFSSVDTIHLPIPSLLDDVQNYCCAEWL